MVVRPLRIYIVVYAPPAVYITIWLLSVYVFIAAGRLYDYIVAQRLRAYIVVYAPPAVCITI